VSIRYFTWRTALILARNIANTGEDEASKGIVTGSLYSRILNLLNEVVERTKELVKDLEEELQNA